MPFSSFLESRREDCRALVAELSETFSYVSVLGSDTRSKSVQANRNLSAIQENIGSIGCECGFVVKMHNGDAFYEYSLDDVSGDKKLLAEKILSAIQTDDSLKDKTIHCPVVKTEILKQSFLRESDFDDYSDEQLLSFCTKCRDELLSKDEHIVNAIVYLSPFTTSKLFISTEKELDQHYGWCNAFLFVLYRDGKMVQAREGVDGYLMKNIFEKLSAKTDALVEKARKLVTATPIQPGIYDIITDSSITGLIAHEAFGHGVEMDQFVKDRALAKSYIGEYVASPIVNMHDGASATLSIASYFFDDDGILAHDTQIIKDGILVAGLSDLTSASELGTTPTGNGRRQSYKRKAYSRMTNTFISAGKDKLEDMIASIDHGYMLFETNNGMEDPKNWQIQCTAEYGIEIVDGKLTDHYVSPVVMSGYVPDLLKSISMISETVEMEGAGGCGKGYKEWVRVSSGGPALKARVKLA